MLSNVDYVMRGQRVKNLQPECIQHVASRAVSILNINKKTIKRMDRFIDELYHKFGIQVDVIDDKDWLGFADALCDPSQFTIALPNKLYMRLVKAKDTNSLFIFFHELGHLLLGHKTLLHHATTIPNKFEDAEWQADIFSEEIMKKIGRYNLKQIEFDFE